MSASLTAIQIVALAGCVKTAALNDAKKSLAENSTKTVDFKIRIHGSVQKGVGLTATTSTEPATVCLTNTSAVCAVLRQLGIGSKRLRAALEGLPAAAQITDDAELAKVFEDVAAARAAKLPPRKVSIAGKAAAVTSQVSAVLL